MRPPTVVQTGIQLDTDRSRVITQLFVPGNEDVGPGDSRATPVIERILQLSEVEVEASMRDLDNRFGHRHRDLHGTFLAHAELVGSRVSPGIELSPARRLLLGASFTHEFSIEAAALCNPSAVLYPEPDPTGDARFVMSVRSIGEGHRSSIGFRTGTVSAAGKVTIDPTAPFPVTGTVRPGVLHRRALHAKLAELNDDHENAAYVLDPLPLAFLAADLETRIARLQGDFASRRHTPRTVSHLRTLAQSSYRVEFDAQTDLSERVLWPHAPAENQGMEDARFVRFVEPDGAITYYATYTAYDGLLISQQLLSTTDFRRFSISPVAGIAARGKGLAIFPRKIAGRYVALSRSDRETNGIAFSNDIRCWDEVHVIQTPIHSWELLQLGNCGSPIETEAGWLVLTHGVGPMRTYALGVILLDLDDPRRVIARSSEPILTPSGDRREGYVPNVVYSCGAFAHGDTLVIPYGIADQTISVATLSITDLLSSLRAET
jgi:predicted GH43/DUF377 family glycosyl hydrolase